MRRALIPGSFDPVTQGHMFIIQKAAELFDEVSVVLFENPEKTYLFTLEERKELLLCACKSLPNVKVDVGTGFTADYAKEGEFQAILRGIRNKKDQAYENEMALFNQKRGGVPTMILETPPALHRVSSTAVRERLEKNLDLFAYVPSDCVPLLYTYYATKKPTT